VPILIWLKSLQWDYFDDWTHYIWGVDNYTSARSPQNDPLLNYLKDKLQSHAGFISESIVESVPMAIIQMVAIVQYDEIELINIISLMLSLISIGSKTLVLS
jgi:hypothetical protein